MPSQSSAIVGLIGEAGGLEQLLVLEQTSLEKARIEHEVAKLRQSGEGLYVYSNDETFLERIADEIWWMRGGEVVAKGDPREVLDKYRRWVAGEMRAWGQGHPAELTPAMRRGDGRARLEKLEPLGADGLPTLVWASGEKCALRVTVRFAAGVADPVVGIMLRTLIGMEVYGTNTQLERVKLGPVKAGDTRVVIFEFPCLLCPQEYTVTAASHDPDGVWHDWVEDAVAIRVSDVRYTAGVANLRAKVRVES